MSEIVNGMAQNEPTGKHVHTRSSFPLQYLNFDTFRFGEYHPHFVMEGVAKDKISFRSAHELRSYTLKAPLMEEISMKKDYFAVPMTAILPLNWDKFFANPVNGQDIPSTDVGPSSTSFYTQIAGYMNGWRTRLGALLNAGSTTEQQALTSLLRYLAIGEYFYSTGSLLASLGCHLYHECKFTDTSKTFDDQVDTSIGVLIGKLDAINVLDTNGNNLYFSADINSGHLNFRDLMNHFRDDPGSTVASCVYQTGETAATMKADLLSNLWSNANGSPFGVLSSGAFNLSRLAAFQLVCAQFYTNDSIDFIFDANRYRQLMWYYFSTVSTATSFTQNGLSFLYDAFSGHCLDEVLAYGVTNISSGTHPYGRTTTQICFYSFLSGLFAYRRSLRFKDYFTGSHAHPLAVADSSFDASNTSVIDITKNIQRQRFYNAVNRVGGRIQDYMKEIFNSTLAPDYHDPFYIAHTSDVVYGSEVENTGSDQLTRGQSVTSALRSNGSRYEFTYEPDRDCILIGLTYFDIARAYDRSVDRHFFHLDRFDWFNPYMQFVGDQKVYQEEINAANANGNLSAFAYQLRHMEYKQRFNVMQGGFVKNLPGWAFPADPKHVHNTVISPDFIRSRSTELDPFYVSLTGIGLGNYFHFIVKNINNCTASRPMAYAPSIL